MPTNHYLVRAYFNLTSLVASKAHKAHDQSLYKVFMLVDTSDALSSVEGNQFSIFTQKFHNSVSKTIGQFRGSVDRSNNSSYWVWFADASDAVLCAMEIRHKFKYVTPKNEAFKRQLAIGVTLVPEKASEKIQNKAIRQASRMCEYVDRILVFSSEVRMAYEKENKNAKVDRMLVRVLSASEETFLTRVLDHVEKNSLDPTFTIAALGADLQIGKSRLYRTMVRLTSRSPSQFIREFRLAKALKMLHDRTDTISGIAQACGFQSPSYFSRCFREYYGLLPSRYLQQHAR
ncbi:MAG: AraC family transcriptional regulator [Bacteroidota bacterium]